MSIVTLPVGTKDIPPATVAPEDNYKLRIAKAEPKTISTGSNCIELTLDIIDLPNTVNYWPVRHTLFLPGGGTPEQDKMSSARLNAFKEAFGMPLTDQFMTEELIGLVAEASLVITPYEGKNGKPGGVKNTIKGSFRRC